MVAFTSEETPWLCWQLRKERTQFAVAWNWGME
jgi:hypothetical protein